jgi:hypothetical protein
VNEYPEDVSVAVTAWSELFTMTMLGLAKKEKSACTKDTPEMFAIGFPFSKYVHDIKLQSGVILTNVNSVMLGGRMNWLFWLKSSKLMVPPQHGAGGGEGGLGRQHVGPMGGPFTGQHSGFTGP